ncbi:MAG: alanine racemase [Candidatus Hodarchaeales archaeon]
MNIEKPIIILKRDRVLRNIKRMAEKARKNSIRFRPHFKTHQSVMIGEWFREQGVTAITTSSIEMAIHFSNHGWKDITIAFPVNTREIKKINTLAKEITLNLLVESEESIRLLRDKLTFPVNAWIKVDVGYKRTGIPFNKDNKVIELAREIEKANNLSLSGLLTHAGHAYKTKSVEQVTEIHFDSVSKMNHTKEVLVENGFPGVQLSIGDTPTCSIVDDLSGVDEIRPGNFVFYDLMQLALGSCSEEDIAIAVACPVVAKHEERKELVIYGGAIHFSKDYLVREDGTRNYGMIATTGRIGWGSLSKSYISSLSQEHGIVKVEDNLLNNIKVGDLLMILPVHSCLTVNLLREFLVLS